MIAHSRPTLLENDFTSALKVLKSGHIAQGNQVAEFEEGLATFIGMKGGVATSSGTSALHLALLALGIKEGDEVVVPSYVCSAPLNAINYVRATPVLVDINPSTFNLSVRKLIKRVTKNTKAIIVPHLFGLPAEMDEILSLGVPVIEDAAQALGGIHKAKKVGSFGLLSVFSFYATKVITTGEGGMLLSNSEDLLEKVRDLNDYDKKRDYKLRYNYKMTDLQAALGISQLNKLPMFLKRRKDIAYQYSSALKECPVILPSEHPDSTHIYYRYVVQVEGNVKNYIELLQKEGICCDRPVYRPLHHYLELDNCLETDRVWNTALSIPIYPSLSDGDVEKVIQALKRILAD
jgi:perosamine synthetase